MVYLRELNPTLQSICRYKEIVHELFMMQPLPPRVDPLDHNGSYNGTRTGDEICDPVGGATMLPLPAGRAP